MAPESVGMTLTRFRSERFCLARALGYLLSDFSVFSGFSPPVERWGWRGGEGGGSRARACARFQ